MLVRMRLLSRGVGEGQKPSTKGRQGILRCDRGFLLILTSMKVPPAATEVWGFQIGVEGSQPCEEKRRVRGGKVRRKLKIRRTKSPMKSLPKKRITTTHVSTHGKSLKQKKENIEEMRGRR